MSLLFTTPPDLLLILRGGAFIILFLFGFANCGGNSDFNPEPKDVSRNFIIEPTREVVRDPNCPKPEKNNPFIAEVVSYHIGPGGGYHWKSLPNVVLGAPQGSGTLKGSYDTFSLGQGGDITIKMGVPILDGEGPDFIVFENGFYISGDPTKPYAEPGEIWVSKDGTEGSFVKFPCDGGNWRGIYPGCAGINPVFANPFYNQIDPTDPKTAGGDSFDLSEVGLNCVRYIKIIDATPLDEMDHTLPSQLNDISNREGDVGFDLDAISVVYY